jgi:chromosome condensin MukBEF MukE localization factor
MKKVAKRKAREWSKDQYKYWKELHNKRFIIDLDPELEKFLYKYENEAIFRKRTKE